MLRPRYIVAYLLIAGLSLCAMQAASAKPITKRGLVDALKIGGLTTSELVRKIKERGVNFAVTPEVEDELRKAGAPPEVVQAVRDNFRRASGAPSKSPVTVEKK